MKKLRSQHRCAGRGFTLIELLVVIAIIGILAGLLLPVLGRAKIAAKVGIARVDIKNLEGAISKYENEYSRFPASHYLRERVPDGDFTYGTEIWQKDGHHTSLYDYTYKTPYDTPKGKAPKRQIVNGYQNYENCNAEVMAALLDRTNLFWNSNHAINPNKTGFLTVKEVSDPKLPGVGPDGVYRDPWGNPYIVTVDLNGDNKCRDAFYRQDSVSQVSPAKPDQGLNGLSRATP